LPRQKNLADDLPEAAEADDQHLAVGAFEILCDRASRLFSEKAPPKHD
jgi:hypothetical protein